MVLKFPHNILFVSRQVSRISIAVILQQQMQRELIHHQDHVTKLRLIFKLELCKIKLN
jgi:hypothetical protein